MLDPEETLVALEESFPGYQPPRRGNRLADAYAATESAGGSVSSGHRSYAEQAQLYQAYLAYKAGTGPKANKAAPPGTSDHERDEAIDVRLGVSLAKVVAALRAKGIVPTQAFLENDHYHIGWGARHAQAANARRGAGGRGGRGDVTIGTLVVQTQATDAQGIARDLPGAIRRRGLTAQAATGMD